MTVSATDGETLCGKSAPICKGDGGPVTCKRPEGHEGDHFGRDYDHEVWPQQSFRNWRGEGMDARIISKREMRYS